MKRARMLALAAPAAFAVLAGVLVAVRALPGVEAAWAAASVALAFVPSGLIAPAGWRRRATEAALLPAGYALTMLDDPTLRRLALPPLLLLAAWAATAAALRRASAREGRALVVAFALAARVAGGLGLTGWPWWRGALVFAVAALAAWGAVRIGGAAWGMGGAALAATLPWETATMGTLLAIAAFLATFALLAPRSDQTRPARAWSPALLAASLLLAAVAPWGGLIPQRAFPAANRWSLAALAGAAAITPFLPQGLAGAAWFAATFALGPGQPPPPDQPGLQLTAEALEACLPASGAGVYALDLALANAAALPSGTPVATVLDVGNPLVLRAGSETAEWAHERAGVRRVVAHPLPREPIWAPAGLGRAAVWGVAGRIQGRLPAGIRPRLVRDPGLPRDVVLSVTTAGTLRPTPPRDWPLSAWILATALAVAVLQAASGCWRGTAATLPWTLLIVLSLVLRMPVGPLRLLGERHAVDLALAAFLAAWLPAARIWLLSRRAFLAAATLLLSLAIATPHLTPPLYGDEPFHLIVLDSLARDHDLDLSNNYDLEHHPYNRIYISGFLHSPVLAFLLLPGYLALGRTGALALLALAGAGVAALLARRAEGLGCPPRRVALLSGLLLLGYPLATFSTQIWAEVPGALAAAASLVLLATPHPRRFGITGLVTLLTTVKTRLALLLFPLAGAAWWPSRWRARELRNAALVLGAAAGLGLAVGWATFGNPLGNRTLAMLIPYTASLPARVVGGLLFDAAGGMAFSAPLLLLGLGGLAALWRHGGAGERALALGACLTVLALLHSTEWYGGGAPPWRYLVPALPLFALTTAMVLRTPSRWRRPGVLLLPPSVGLWWVLVTRPHFSINPGDGGFWLADALARRFSADARHLFPSFLRLSPAAYIGPVVIVAVGASLIWAARRWSTFARAAGRLAVPLWLLAAALLVTCLFVRTDRIVEIADPQIVRLGGRPEPPPGTFSRFTHPNGWRVADGQGVEVPLHLPAHAHLRLTGWLEGQAQGGATVEAAWDGGPVVGVAVAGRGSGTVPLPDPAGGGRHRLRLVLHAPSGGEAIFERLVVTR